MRHSSVFHVFAGPPGIGKTTLAAVIARELGYEVFEMNASDTRNKAAVQDSLTSVVVSTTVNVHV
jgi:replication-associated recombination protein RarA